MASDQKLELTLAELVNLINALALGSYIYHFSVESTVSKQYKQLPRCVSLAFYRLDNAVNNDEFHILDPWSELEYFLNSLRIRASHNYFRAHNSENNHAEYLLGLLMHHNIYLKRDGKCLSLNEMIMDEMPRRYQQFIGGVLYDISMPHFYFLSAPWREKQKYPDLNKLKVIWKAELEKQNNEKLRLQQQEEEEERNKQIRNLQRAQYIATHTFEGLVLDLEYFSYAIEGFVKIGRISLFNGNQYRDQKPTLCADLSTLIIRFSQIARSHSREVSTSYALAMAFENMMKAIIYTAKYTEQLAAQLLLGFMLYHNFRISHGNKTFNISEIAMAEMTLVDYQVLYFFGPSKYFFLFREWQIKQGFPGRCDLERVITADKERQQLCQPRPIFMPFFQQRLSTLPPAKQPESFIDEMLNAFNPLHKSFR